jgi:hypothetical protein
MLQVSRNGLFIGYSGRIEGAREIVRCESPGCFDVDEIRADQFHLGFTPRRWGNPIAYSDERVEEEPHQLR